jgi:S1-C subfamily serine protease
MAKRILFLGTLFLLLAGISNLAAFGSREDDTETTAVQQEKTIDIQDIQTQVEKIFADSHQSVVKITSTVVTPNMFNQPVPQQGAGSGFVWDEEGHIVTNFHVVQNAESITVSFGNDEMLEAELVGSDLFTDLAVLEVEKDNLPPPLPIGNSEDVSVGEFVVAIGNPFSFERTLTFGVVSAIGRVIRSTGGRFISEAIQTDTPINPGNSVGRWAETSLSVSRVNRSQHTRNWWSISKPRPR